MAADRTLAEDHQAARHDVGALDRDRDRRALPAAADIVLRAELDALAAVYVDDVLGNLTGEFGAVVLRDRRRYRRFLAAIDRRSSRQRQRTHLVRVAADARERFLDA